MLPCVLVAEEVNNQWHMRRKPSVTLFFGVTKFRRHLNERTATWDLFFEHVTKKKKKKNKEKKLPCLIFINIQTRSQGFDFRAKYLVAKVKAV